MEKCHLKIDKYKYKGTCSTLPFFIYLFSYRNQAIANNISNIIGIAIIWIEKYFLYCDFLNILKKEKIITIGPMIVTTIPKIRNAGIAYDNTQKYKPIRTHSTLPIQYNII